VRTLEEIETDLQLCSEYLRIGTLQAAMRFCEDLRRDLLELTSHVKALRLETLETTLPGYKVTFTLKERVEKLEETVERIDAGS